MEKKEPLFQSTPLTEMSIDASSVKNSNEVPQKLINLPRDPAILLLGIYPKNMKTLIQKDIGTPMFTATLLNRAKI